MKRAPRLLAAIGVAVTALTAGAAMASRKRGIVIVTALAASLLGLFMTAAPSMAAPATTAQVISYSLAAHVSAATVIRPDIEPLPCSDETAFHLYTANGTFCYGFTGIELFTGNAINKACAGNNYGSLRYYDPERNEYFNWQFAPGHVKAWTYYVDAISLTITGYSGSDIC
jgi:hypothetical protein